MKQMQKNHHQLKHSVKLSVQRMKKAIDDRPTVYAQTVYLDLGARVCPAGGCGGLFGALARLPPSGIFGQLDDHLNLAGCLCRSGRRLSTTEGIGVWKAQGY